MGRLPQLRVATLDRGERDRRREDHQLRADVRQRRPDRGGQLQPKVLPRQGRRRRRRRVRLPRPTPRADQGDAAGGPVRRPPASAVVHAQRRGQLLQPVAPPGAGRGAERRRAPGDDPRRRRAGDRREAARAQGARRAGAATVAGHDPLDGAGRGRVERGVHVPAEQRAVVAAELRADPRVRVQRPAAGADGGGAGVAGGPAPVCCTPATTSAASTTARCCGSTRRSATSGGRG